MLVLLLLVSFLLLPDASQAQPLPCALQAFFESVCPEGATSVAPVPAAPLAPLPPLFPKETLAHDIPPLMVSLLDAPTVENARAFKAWHLRRLARIQEVNRLLQSLEPVPQKEVLDAQLPR